MTVHLDAEVFERGDARRRGEPPCRPADQILVDAGDLAELGDIDRSEPFVDGLETDGVLAEPRLGGQPFLDDHRDHRRQQPGVAARCDLEVEVGEFGGLGDPRIDHDHRALFVLGDRLERGAGARDAVAHPWVLADEEGDFAVVELAAHGVAEHDAVDPDFAALLLADGAAAVPATETLVQRGAVGPAQMVALTAAPVVDDLVAAELVADRTETLGHLARRRVPVDLFEGAVVTAAKRVEHPFASTVLVVVESQRLLARVPLRRRMVLVATDAFERVPDRTETDLDTAVALTQDACRLVPGRLDVGARVVGGGVVGGGHVVVPLAAM